MKRTGQRIAASLVALTVFLCLDVAVGRLERFVAEWTTARADQSLEESERKYRIPHPYYHHDLLGNYSGLVLWQPAYTMHTNSLGFRDVRPRDIPPRTEAVRILVMGDSFTEGIGLDFERTFAGRLAASYLPMGIEVLNAGVVSYSPAIYWKKAEYLLERHMLKFDAVVVFLDISDVHDEAWEYRIDLAGQVVDAGVRPVFDLADSWMMNSLAFRGGMRILQWLHPHPPRVGCTIIDEGYMCRSAWTLSPLALDRYGRDGLSRADRHMTRLAALLRARGIPLTIVVYPWPQQLLWDDRSSLQVIYWRKWAARENARFVELFSVFFAEVDARGRSEAIGRYFIKGRPLERGRTSPRCR